MDTDPIPILEKFEDRKNLLFASLETAEKSITKGTSLEQQTDEDTKNKLMRLNFSTRAKRDREALRFQGKESIFKRPHQPIEKCLKSGTTPGFRANPKKWIKYSLDDVDVMSEKSNSAAAFAFLREIEDRKQNGDDSVEDRERIEFNSSKHKRIPFNKSVGISSSSRFTDITDTPEAGSDGPLLRGSKLVMPEYVIGQKVRKEKRKLTNSGSKRTREIKLDHLMEEDDDDDDDVII